MWGYRRDKNFTWNSLFIKRQISWMGITQRKGITDSLMIYLGSFPVKAITRLSLFLMLYFSELHVVAQSTHGQCTLP